MAAAHKDNDVSFRAAVTLGQRFDVHDSNAIFESEARFKTKAEALRHVPLLVQDLFSKETTVACGEIVYDSVCVYFENGIEQEQEKEHELELGVVLAYFQGRAIQIGTYEIRGTNSKTKHK